MLQVVLQAPLELADEIREIVEAAGYRLVPTWAPEPELIERVRYGDWLAVSPDGYRFPIGVLGSTAEEAEAKWHHAAEAWDRLLPAD